MHVIDLPVEEYLNADLIQDEFSMIDSRALFVCFFCVPKHSVLGVLKYHKNITDG